MIMAVTDQCTHMSDDESSEECLYHLVMVHDIRIKGNEIIIFQPRQDCHMLTLDKIDDDGNEHVHEGHNEVSGVSGPRLNL